MKLNKKYLAPLCSLFVTGGLLLTIGVLVMGSSFGWFSNNDRVTASGLSVSSISPYKTTENLYMLDEETNQLVKLENVGSTTLFSNMLPTDQRTVYLEVTNNESDTPLSLDVLLSAPNNTTNGGTDSGYSDENGYYYFGSQIRITNIQISDSTGALSNDATANICAVDGTTQAYLLTIPAVDGENSFYDENGLQGVGATANQITAAFQNASQKKLTDANSITVPAGETVYIAFTFEFVENNQVQNPYIDFANKAGITAEDTAKELERKNCVLTRELLCQYSAAQN